MSARIVFILDHPPIILRAAFGLGLFFGPPIVSVSLWQRWSRPWLACAVWLPVAALLIWGWKSVHDKFTGVICSVELLAFFAVWALSRRAPAARLRGLQFRLSWVFVAFAWVGIVLAMPRLIAGKDSLDLTIAAISGLAGAAMWIAICIIGAQPGSGCGTLFVVLLAICAAIAFINLSGTVAIISIHIVVAAVWNACCGRWTGRAATASYEGKSR